MMNSPRNHHHEHHDVHQQRLLWFFSFCNQRSSSSSSGSNSATRRGSTKIKSASSRNKFALQYQQQLLQQQRQRQSSNVFGRDLTEHTRMFNDDDSVPNIVKSCTQFIEKHGIIFGIYRLSGTRGNINKLRQDFDKNPRISMIDCGSISNDAHAVACVLKQYFRELPTPLLTFHMYEKFIDLFKHSTIIHQDSETDISDIDNPNDSQEARETQNHNVHIVHSARKHDKIRSESAIKMINVSRSIQGSQPTTITAQPQSNVETIVTSGRSQPHIITSVSDSQLISLSSVVATTASDVKYIVRLDELRRLLLKLPNAHYQTLKYLMRHLAFMASKGQKTGMDSKNVAIVWAPNLLKPPEINAELETLQVIGLQAVITEQLIKHHKFLFDDPTENTVLESVHSNTRQNQINPEERVNLKPSEEHNSVTITKSDQGNVEKKIGTQDDVQDCNPSINLDEQRHVEEPDKEPKEVKTHM